MRKHTIFGRLIFIALSLLLTVVISVNFFSLKIVSLYATYAKGFSQNLATFIINKATNELLTNKYDDESFFIVDTEKAEIINFNTQKINGLLIEVTNKIFQHLDQVKSGYLPDEFAGLEKVSNHGGMYYIPFSTVSKNVFLNAFGPKIPIRLALLGSVKGEIKSQIRSYGLNNAFVELDIIVSLGMSVVVPFESEKVDTEVNIPLVIQAIQGNIPNILWGTSIVDTVYANIEEGVMV